MAFAKTIRDLLVQEQKLDPGPPIWARPPCALPRTVWPWALPQGLQERLCSHYPRLRTSVSTNGLCLKGAL